MTPFKALSLQPADWQGPAFKKRLKRRYFFDHLLRAFGFLALWSAGVFLLFLLSHTTKNGIRGFYQTFITLEVDFTSPELRQLQQRLADAPNLTEKKRDQLYRASLLQIDMRALLVKSLEHDFPNHSSPADKRLLLRLFSNGIRGQMTDYLANHPDMIGKQQKLKLLASNSADLAFKAYRQNKDQKASSNDYNRLHEKQKLWLAQLRDNQQLSLDFNWGFFKNGDSREPELAGIHGALVGSAFTLFITFIISFPLGLCAALYLEEFAPRNKITDLIEININNLAAVPSIIYGLLGLALFLGPFGLPRSASLVGGLTLALMALPTIIITARAALRALPTSLREAASGLGASPVQRIFHHLLPAAMPGILTGTLISLSQVFGETAPLLMIGMVAFIVDIPNQLLDPATVLPVQIFLWSDSSEPVFKDKTSAAILVLLCLLTAMNGLAFWLRQYFERKWRP